MTERELQAAADRLRVASRAAQGLPPTVQDDHAIARVAALIVSATHHR